MNNKKKRFYYRLIIFLLVLFIPFISIGYSALSTTLNIRGDILSKYINPRTVTFPDEIEEILDNETCVSKYEGQVTDQVGVTKEAENVYFNECADKRNIIFNNMCWRMIRTTETGGIKMMYNGDVVNGKCESTRGDRIGIVGSEVASQTLNASYLYGDSFTYDTTNNTFTLTNPEVATWSNSTYEDLIGKYTCKNTTGICTNLYNVNGYSSNTKAYVSSYSIGNTNYAQIGTSAFNANYRSPAMVGYMFNKEYNYKYILPMTTEYKYGSGFTYDESTNTYTLSGTIKYINDWSTGYNTINDTHYTCWNTSGTCNEISYIYYTTSSYAYYIGIIEGKGVNDILEEMLSDDSVNKYSSSIKGIIDAWYSQNLSSKTNMLEDTVYCNARNIVNYGGWNSHGGSTISGYNLFLKNGSASTTDLSCLNVTDQFSVSNNKAKLVYPVGLLQEEEVNNINNMPYSETGVYYWDLSPRYFGNEGAVVHYLLLSGGYSVDNVNHIYGTRPVISLKNSTIFSSGTGSETDPWIVE